jgi:hypothetical protein
MLTLMLDPRFKSLNVVKTFVGGKQMIQMVANYDNKTLLLLLVAVFQILNSNCDGLIKATLIDGDENSIFGVVTSFMKSLYTNC